VIFERATPSPRGNGLSFLPRVSGSGLAAICVRVRFKRSFGVPQDRPIRWSSGLTARSRIYPDEAVSATTAALPPRGTQTLCLTCRSTCRMQSHIRWHCTSST